MPAATPRFTPLGNGIFLSPAAPDARLLAIVCTWVGAKSKHIRKYTDQYASAYPEAQILYITASPLDMTARPSRTVRRNLEPAIEVIKRFTEYHIKPDKGIEGKAWLHAFSNGGAFTARHLAAILQADEYLQGRFRLSSLILDSCPSHADLSTIAGALSTAVSDSPVVRAFASVSVYGLVYTLDTLDVVGRRMGRFAFSNPVEETYKNILEMQLFDPKTVPRLYVFSKADAMIKYEDVIEHAERAVELGGGDQVRQTMFVKSAHCSHMTEDAAKYWRSIRWVLEKGGVIPPTSEEQGLKLAARL